MPPKKGQRQARGLARQEQILDVAFDLFADNGVRQTTIAAVADRVGLSEAGVLHHFTSKEDLLLAVLDAYVTSLTDGWEAVLRSDASPIEKLDALLWLDVNILERFSEEHRIQSVSLQHAPPTSPDLGLSFPSQLRRTRALLAAADDAGELRPFPASADVRSRCVFSLIWTPQRAIHRLGTHGAHRFARATLLRGATTEGTTR